MKKSHLIILAVLLVLIAVYFIARGQRPLEKEVRFFGSDSTEIAKMMFFTPADTIIIEKKTNEWKLVHPIQWEVNENHLELFFKRVFNIKTSTTPMSEDTELQRMYKVDDLSAVQVKLYDSKGKMLEHAYIGNGANTSFDYGRKANDKKIYQFKDNITNLVKPDIFQWRSPNITNLKRSQIDYIDVKYTKNAYSLTVIGDSIRYSDKNETFVIPFYNRAQHKIINALENLMTWQFIDKDTDQYANQFKNPDCRVVVHLKDKRTKSFTMIRKVEQLHDRAPNEPDYSVTVLMMVDDNITPLYQMTGDFINRFTRASQHFKVEFD